MEKIFRKKLTKKGFTLAELLIVVAIIAILIAIAAPLYVGALDSANEAVFQSNQRAIKSMGVADLLTNWAKLPAGFSTTGPWYATGTIGDNGDITDVTVVAEKPNDFENHATYDKWKTAKGTIMVEIKGSDLKAPTTTGVGG